jgi:hypothetical protein
MDSLKVSGNLDTQTMIIDQVLKMQEAAAQQMAAAAVVSSTAQAGREEILSLLGIGSTINTSA